MISKGRTGNQARVKVAKRILGSMTPSQILQQQLGKVAIRLGGNVVASLLPKPLAVTVKAAMRVTELARKRGLGMSR